MLHSCPPAFSHNQYVDHSDQSPFSLLCLQYLCNIHSTDNGSSLKGFVFFLWESLKGPLFINWSLVLWALLYCPCLTHTRAFLCAVKLPCRPANSLLLSPFTLTAFICLRGCVGQLPGCASKLLSSLSYRLNLRLSVCQSCKLVYSPE